MQKLEQDQSWVIYQRCTNGAASGPNGVCEQDEWDKLERINPGNQVIVTSGIETEGTAEQLARGTSGDTKKRNS